MKNGRLGLIVIKTVHDLLITGENELMEHFLTNFNEIFECGNVVRGPGILKKFGLGIIRNDYLSCTIHGDENFLALELYPLFGSRRRRANSKLSVVVVHVLKFCIKLAGNYSFPTLSIYRESSTAKTAKRDYHCYYIANQISASLKSYEALIHYPAPCESGDHQVSLLVLSDAGRIIDHV